MINEDTGVLESPYNLVTLSRATGNPILDGGYQCCDMRPFFEYNSDKGNVYISIHPINLNTQVVNVYKKGIKNVDGEDYVAMFYLGNTTATSLQTSENTSTIIFEDSIYIWTGNFENIRGFFINKWAKYKSIGGIDTEKDLIRPTEDNDTDEFVSHNCGLELIPITIPTSGGSMQDKYPLIQSMIDDLKAGKFYWIYKPPIEGEWCRWTDFEGYNQKAKNPFYMDIFNIIGPINDGVKDIYCDTKESTYTTKVTIGEYSKNRLPKNNVSMETLPTYFKNLHALGLIYEGSGGVGYGFVDPYNPEDKESEGFLYPLSPGGEVEIPLTVRIGSIYSIGAFLINKDSGDTGYYFPIKPLHLRFLRIPDIVNVVFNYYAQGKDLVIVATATRNGNTWWWGTHRPDAAIIEARTTTNYAPFNDLPIQVYTKKGTSQQWENEANDDRPSRHLVKNGQEYEWNGCDEVNVQAGIETPISVVPDVVGMESVTFYFRFLELKDAPFLSTEKANPGSYEVKIEGNLYLGTTDSGYRTQMLSLGREVFEEVGWLDPLNTEE